MLKLRKWMLQYRQCFQQACLDLVQLWDVDWDASFCCASGGPARQLTADGIQVGHKLAQCCLQRPWEPSTGASLQPGTLLSRRIFIAAPAIRQPLLEYTTSKQGLSEARLSALRSAIEQLPDAAQERSILPFLQDSDSEPAAAGGTVIALRSWRTVLHSLATTAPIIQLVPQRLWQSVQRLGAGQRLTRAAEKAVKDASPVLFNFVHPHTSSAAGLPPDFTTLLTCMLEVIDVSRQSALRQKVT